MIFSINEIISYILCIYSYYNFFINIKYYLICNVYSLLLCQIKLYLSKVFSIKIDNNYMSIFITACMAQLAKASETKSVGRGFKPRPDH